VYQCWCLSPESSSGFPTKFAPQLTARTRNRPPASQLQQCPGSLKFGGQYRLLPMFCRRTRLLSHDKRVRYHPLCVFSYNSERPINDLCYFAIRVTTPLVSLNYVDLFKRQLSRGTPLFSRWNRKVSLTYRVVSS
jgi:hypothetical protein